MQNARQAISVPCRGTTFLNGKDHKGKYIYLNNFRPLSGNYISQSGNTKTEAELRIRFPSPVGELHFSISSGNSLHIFFAFPSPVGELHFSIQISGCLEEEMGIFPSPVGELHFSMDNKAPRQKQEAFPSPVGELHFSMVSLLYQYSRLSRFPSPVGELHFSIPSLQSRHQSGLMVGIAWEKYFWKNK